MPRSLKYFLAAAPLAPLSDRKKKSAAMVLTLISCSLRSGPFSPVLPDWGSAIPSFPASSLRASGKAMLLIFIRKENTSPPSPQPKQ